MTFTKRNLEDIFQELSQRVGEINRERRQEGLLPFQRAKVQLLGQIRVSKAVKAPAKNRQLIREAIVSGEFKTWVDRILKNGGKLEDFA